jgi:hypothetical protein
MIAVARALRRVMQRLAPAVAIAITVPAVVALCGACSSPPRDRPSVRGDESGVPLAATPTVEGAAVVVPDGDVPCDGELRALGPGLTHERWRVEATPKIPVTPCLDVVRADLRHYALRVVTASRDGEARPAPRWLEDLGLVAAVNAGMFHEGGTSVGLLVDGEHVNQENNNSKLGGYLAFGPRDPAAAPVVVAGRDCAGFDLDALKRAYRSVTQSYRLLGCDGGAIAWADPKHYSSAAVGVDRDGKLVMVHVRAPFLMREVSTALARPELRLAGALFVEGGPEATVVVHAAAGDLMLVGSYETGFVEDDHNVQPWTLPNLIALMPR